MPIKSMKTLLTCEEFEKLAPDLEPCELIDGEIVPVSPAGIPHSKVSGRIYKILSNFVEDNDLGLVLTNETGIHVRREPARSRGADILYISYKRLPKDSKAEGFLTVPPELIVEVLGGSWSEMDEKIADYHNFGVDLVWVAEPRKRLLHVYPRVGAKRILRARDTADGGEYLPGFKARVDTFFP